MTAVVAPYRSERPVGRDGFAQLVRAEWTKFRTVRAWVIALGVAGALVVSFAWVSVTGDHTTFCASPQTCTVIRFATAPGGKPVADNFSLLHLPLAGNGSVTAQVTSLTGVTASGNVGPGPGSQVQTTHLAPWAKAGIIVKESTTQGSAYAAVMVTGSHGVRMQYDYTHDTAGIPGAVGALSPRWLRLTRAGDLLTGYDSADGTRWTEIGTAHLAGLPATVQAGLFVTSPLNFPASTTSSSPSGATATFDQVNLQGDFPTHNWHGTVVGAGTHNYPALLPVGSWYHRSSGTFTISGSGDIAPQVGGEVSGGGADNDALLNGAITGLIVVIVLAALLVTSEYRRGLIRTTLAASPRRGRVLAAKSVVIGSVAFLAGCVGTALAQVVARHVLSVGGNLLFPLGTLAETQVILGTGLLFAVAAVLVLALGTMLRRSAGAVVTGIVLLVLPLILDIKLSPGASDWLLRLTPSAAFAVQSTLPRFAEVSSAYTPLNGYYPLGPWAGLAVLCAYAAVALGAATWLLNRRDA